MPAPTAKVRLLRPEILLWPLLCLALSTPGAEAQTSDSLRVATFNTFLRSPEMYCLQSWENVADCLIHYDEVPEQNAVAIAAELMLKDLDVIVLTEVFDEDARATLSFLLAQAGLVHQVTKLDDSVVVPGLDPKFNNLEIEDSGLMLFSRFPFEPLPTDVFKWKKPLLEATTDEVAFVRFQLAADYDQLAAKGVGLVRVKHPSSQEIYTIVFSHTQADYGGDKLYPGVRAKQFEVIERLITITLGTDDLAQEHVFLMGDLNVRGEHGLIHNMAHNGFTGDPTDEWSIRFTMGFFFEEMVDTWASETSPDDLGITHPGDSQRLDYIVASRGRLEEGFCMQHLTREQIANSDHWMVTGDYNLDGLHCDPRHAWAQPPFDEFLDHQLDPKVDHTDIALPGSVQWFRVDLPKDNSTVSIALEPGTEFDPKTNTGFTFELYDPADLSVPIAQYEQMTTDLAAIDSVDAPPGTEGIVFVVPERFFIKVFSPNREYSGDYSLLIHPHTCASSLEPCALLPAEPFFYEEFTANVMVGEEDQAWFHIDMDSADSRDAQHVRLFLDGYDKDVFELEVRDFAKPAEFVRGYTETVHDNGLIQLDADIALGAPVFLVVKRTDPTWADAFDVGWETDLTVLHGESGPLGSVQLRLHCLDETNPESGSDEIKLKMSVDGEPFKTVFSKEYECNDGDVSYSVESAVGVVRFLDSVRFKIVEADSTSADDEAPLLITAEAMAPEASGNSAFERTRAFSGGKYKLTFNVGRTLNGGN